MIGPEGLQQNILAILAEIITEQGIAAKFLQCSHEIHAKFTELAFSGLETKATLAAKILDEITKAKNQQHYSLANLSLQDNSAFMNQYQNFTNGEQNWNAVNDAESSYFSFLTNGDPLELDSVDAYGMATVGGAVNDYNSVFVPNLGQNSSGLKFPLTNFEYCFVVKCSVARLKFSLASTRKGRLPFTVFLPFYGQGRCPTYLISPASLPKPEPSNFLAKSDRIRLVVTPSENFEEWAKKLEKQMFLKGLKIDDNALKLIFLEFHLEGDALVKFENITNSPNPPETYEQTKQALLDAFPVVQDTLFYRQILWDRRQKGTATDGQVASWDNSSLMSTLGDLGGCKPSSGHCVMSDGVAVWNETALEAICPFDPLGGDNQRMPHILVTVNRQAVASAMVNCGATFTLVDKRIVDQLDGVKIEPTNMNPIAANNMSIQILGSIYLMIEVGTIKEIVMALVQESCAADVLLGSNFLFRFKQWAINNERLY
uniref:Uncharacterized protein n=1 Tax=Romanomermis culicivorax TaxID=13658 RepID=A0A915JFZ2_ROMCU